MSHAIRTFDDPTAASYGTAARRLRLVSAAWAAMNRSDLDTGARIDAVLGVGCDMFGAEQGLILDADGDPWRVVHADTTGSAPAEAPRTSGLEAIIEAAGTSFGTLRFLGTASSHSLADRECVEMLASWIGSALTPKETASDAQAEDREKSAFLAHTNHELRAPVSGVIGLSDVLASEVFGPLTERQHNVIQKIRTASEHLLALIADVGDIARIDAGEAQLDLRDVDLRGVAERAVSMLDVAAHLRGVTLTLGVPAGLPPVTGDERRIRQIIINLVSNAIDFTPEGGTVGIEAVVAADKAELSVWDTGVGIAPDQLERIFERYTQVTDRQADANGRGTGLGLALSKHLAELHGGALTVVSVPGSGSTFTLSLPI